jgi:hypothetical protein
MATRETRREKNQKIYQRDEWLHDATVAAGYEMAPVPSLCGAPMRTASVGSNSRPANGKSSPPRRTTTVMIAGHPLTSVVGSIREYEIARKPG